MTAYFFPYIKPFHIQRLRCPDCGTVFRFRPSGYLPRVSTPLIVIFEELFTKRKDRNKQPRVNAHTRRSWLRKLKKRIKLMRSSHDYIDYKSGFSRLLKLGFSPISSESVEKIPFGFFSVHRHSPLFDLNHFWFSVIWFLFLLKDQKKSGYATRERGINVTLKWDLEQDARSAPRKWTYCSAGVKTPCQTTARPYLSSHGIHLVHGIPDSKSRIEEKNVSMPQMRKTDERTIPDHWQHERGTMPNQRMLLPIHRDSWNSGHRQTWSPGEECRVRKK